MSDTVTLSTGESETIHGSLMGAKSYVGMMFGDAYDTWRNLVGATAPTIDDPKKQTLATAVRYLNAQAWNAEANTFEKRDAIAAFEQAQYELAVIIASDPSVLEALHSGSNIQSMSAGSASITFFSPTKAGRGATKLPVIVHRLVGRYLAAANSQAPSGYSSSAGEDSEFADDATLDRSGPF